MSIPTSKIIFNMDTFTMRTLTADLLSTPQGKFYVLDKEIVFSV